MWGRVVEDFEGRIGELSFWLRKMQGGWRVGWIYTTAAEPPAMTDSAVTWRRFAMPQTGLRLTPVMPDMPVVLRPAAPLAIFPGHVEKVYVSVPVTVRVESGEKESFVLCELPTRRLSQSWFGQNTKEGRLCYALKTRAREMLPSVEEPDAPYRVICPLEVVNASQEARAFERFCLHVPRMAVYKDARGLLWSNRCRVTYHGGDTREEAFLDDDAPAESKPSECVAQPREEAGGVLPGILNFFA